MQLLNPSEVKTQFNNKQATDIVQAGYLKRILSDLQKSINTETTKFNENLANQRKVYNDEKVALQGEIQALEGILKVKREERANLMIPVDTLKEKAEILVKELEIKKSNLVKKEEELEDKIELVKERIDELTTREQKIAELEFALMSKKDGIDAESKQISESHEKINKMMSDFNTEVQTKTKELSEKESVLNIEKKRIYEYLEIREKELKDKERELLDKRAAFERAYKQINKN